MLLANSVGFWLFLVCFSFTAEISVNLLNELVPEIFLMFIMSA
jgi:hypothetical protein